MIVINEGEDVYINNTFIEGIEALDSSLVTRELLYVSGDTYNPEIIQKSKRRLRETGIYSMVNLVPGDSLILIHWLIL